jgi:hypothetical protein
MRAFVLAASFCAICAATAFAGEDPMAGFYGNTIIASGGRSQIRVHYRADHTFDLVGSMMLMHRTFKGTWALDGKGNVCRAYVGDAPPGASNPQCVPIAPRKVGEVWKVQGDERTFTLKAGVS